MNTWGSINPILKTWMGSLHQFNFHQFIDFYLRVKDKYLHGQNSLIEKLGGHTGKAKLDSKHTHSPVIYQIPSILRVISHIG